MKSLGKDIEKNDRGDRRHREKGRRRIFQGRKKGVGEPLTEPLEKQAQEIQEKLNTLSSSMTSFGTKMTNAVTAPLTELGGKTIESATEFTRNAAAMELYGQSLILFPVYSPGIGRRRGTV